MREKWIDILRGIGIILVCFGHLSPDIFTETHIYSFHMPLFFFISGYLFYRSKDTRFGEFIKIKARGLIVPYLFFASISVVIGAILKIVSIKDIREIVSNVLFLEGTVGWNAPIWFLVVLFWVETCYHPLHKFLNSKKLTLFIIVISVLGYVFQHLGIILPCGLHVVPVAMTFFHMGVLFYRWNVKSFLMKKRFCTIIICIILNIIFGYIMNIRISVYHQNYGNYVYFYIAAISGILLYSTIALVVKESRLLELYGRNTLIILGTQYILFRFYFVLEGIIGVKLMYTNNLLIAIMLTVITMIIYYLIIRCRMLFAKSSRKA